MTKMDSNLLNLKVNLRRSMKKKMGLNNSSLDLNLSNDVILENSFMLTHETCKLK